MRVKITPRVVMVVLKRDKPNVTTLAFPRAMWASRARTNNTLNVSPSPALQKKGVAGIYFYPNFFIVGLSEEFLKWRCHHCKGTGKAPGDGRTECGFCEHGIRTWG